ncbi:MAG: hypothetical protein LBT00_01070 [Spirochaetaceae bacterium]|nr:hypothetical protein [Spirochaetaceae bacterium]
MKDTLERKIEHEMKFHDLTDEEYDRLDEKWTKATPKVGPNGSGFFSQWKAAVRTSDAFSADSLTLKMINTHKTPAEIVSKMVRERIAASS